MTPFEQIQATRQTLYNDIVAALNKSKTHIGMGLLETDVVGVIEKVKFDYLYDSRKDDER